MGCMYVCKEEEIMFSHSSHWLIKCVPIPCKREFLPRRWCSVMSAAEFTQSHSLSMGKCKIDLALAR